MSAEQTTDGAVEGTYAPTKSIIRTEAGRMNWECGSETHEKFEASLSAAIRKAFEESLPSYFNVEYSLEDVVAEALPHALKQFAEDVMVSFGPSATEGDMGVTLTGLEGDFEMAFDLGEVILADLDGVEDWAEAIEDRALWLEKVAAKLRREATAPVQEYSTAAVPLR